MKLSDATKVLKAHQEWRLGANTEMENPKVITEAIYVILRKLEPKKKPKQVSCK